jgi:hypothetical protein
MSDQKENKQKKLNIQLDDDIAQGKYSNLAIINHSATEFVLDFVNVMPGSPKSKVQSRIILTPQHAKRLLKALNDNIHRFENSNGKIEEKEKHNIPLNFGPTGQA